MFFEIILFVAAGVIVGTFTGLIPGIHVNMIAAFVLGFSLTEYPLFLGAFLISLGVTHSFVDFIPSIYLGAPDPSTALAVLPGHKYLLRGHAHMAIFLSVVGGVVAIFLLLLFLPVIFAFLPQTYAALKGTIPLLLFCIMTYMILIEKNKKSAFLVFVLSGILGMLSFKTYLNETQIFTALLSGLFGLSTIATTAAHNTKAPKQSLAATTPAKDAIVGGFLGFLAGLAAGILPAIGSSQSAILMNNLAGKKGARKYIISLGAINTINILLSVLAIYLIGRSRSGIAVAVEGLFETVALNDVLFFVGVGILSTAFAATTTIHISKKISKNMLSINYKKLNCGVFVFLLASILIIAGSLGILIALTGMFLGIYAQIVRVKKSLLLGALVVPVFLVFIGL